MFSLIRDHHVRHMDPSLPATSSPDWAQHVFESDPIRTAFKLLQSWRMNQQIEPEIYQVAPASTFTPYIEPTFAGTRINTQGYEIGRRRPLNVLEFRDIYMVQGGGGFVLFNMDGFSRYSTAVPNFLLSSGLNTITVKDGFFCGDRFSPENICHFTFDHLGRAALALTHAACAEKSLFLPSVSMPYSKQMMNFVVPNARILSNRKIYHFQRLRMFQESSFGRIEHPGRYCDPPVIAQLRSAIAEVMRSGDDSRDKIYVTRRDQRRRRLNNESELENRLVASGFMIFDPAQHAPLEQLKSFALAKTIISPHGAALTSIVASHRDTKVVELFNPKWGTLAYRQVAAALDLHYRPIIGHAEDDNSWNIDIDKVIEALTL